MDYQPRWSRGGGGRGGRGGRGGNGRGWAQRPDSGGDAVFQRGQAGYGRGRGTPPGHWAPVGRGGSAEYVAVRAPAPAPPATASASADTLSSSVSSLRISPTPRNPPGLELTKRFPIQRPDHGGTSCIRTIKLLVNHFLVNCKENSVILHYDIDIKPEKPPKDNAASELSKSKLLSIKDELFKKDLSQAVSFVAYDGERNLYSAIELPSGQFSVEVRGRAYIVSLEFKKQLQLSRLIELPVPREVLQGLDVVMREASSWQRIVFGRGFYSKQFDSDCDLGWGIVALQGSQQTLKRTERGLVLCVDYSVLPFRKPLPVLDFLWENLGIDIRYNTHLNRQQMLAVERALKGVKVTVIHRRTNQKYLVSGLTDLITKDITFKNEKFGGEMKLVDYFSKTYNKVIMYKELPCLDLSKSKEKPNYVPMEFCVLLEGQRYPKDNLDPKAAKKLRDMALALPRRRKDLILKMINSRDGPCRGEVVNNFGVSVTKDMMQVPGRVLNRPDLKLSDSNGKSCKFKILKDDCQWNLLNNKLSKGQKIDHWAILDFSATPAHPRQQRLNTGAFVVNIVKRCCELGIQMREKPLFIRDSKMAMLSNYKSLSEELASMKSLSHGHDIQLLICPMSVRHPGYKSLKLMCETELGIVTQCCLSENANNIRGKDQYFANLALKINAKLGGSNIELFDALPRMAVDCPFMFIGADVNHAPKNTNHPAIAAVVASLNFPASSRFASRIRAQPHGTERIIDLGQMCRELVDMYAQFNGTRPQKIIYFRDGVSDGQFDMVLNEELRDLKAATETDGYSPTITVVVAKKRHHTRLFPADEGPQLGTKTGNVPPGTVVDTGIVDPMLFNFYLCSHNGNLGTSKPTHYYGLLDDHQFTSDELQNLIHHLCFTYARCTKPVSLVPPVYYADLAAFRGRVYHEGMLESPALVSSASSSSTSASDSSGHATLPKLHMNVEDKMFYL